MAKKSKLPTTSTSVSTTGTINTTSTTGTYLTSTATAGIPIGIWTTYTSKCKYIVLDKEIEVYGMKDINVSLCVSLINTLGIKYYIELKKQDISLPDELSKFLDKEVISYYRNKTIDKIIK